MSASPRPGTVCETEGHGPAAASFGSLAAATRHGPGFRWTVLRRHGRRPLAVLSRSLLQGNNRCAGLPYWSEICIHETAASHFAACVCHAAPGAAGPTWCDSWLCESAEAVRTACFGHDPLVALPSYALPQGTTLLRPSAPGIAELSASGEAVSLDAEAAQRFRGAWAGLLAAMFGRHQPDRPLA